ncbi:MAG: MMPL family transporter [Clostridia bacterium]|nr:MMPL family transporter [Clostridia bacterium]
MKKFAAFLTKHRVCIFIVTVVVAVACTVLMPFVNINEDMTSYLPSSSNMRQGLDIMEDEFGTIEMNGEFSLMFEGLSESEKEAMYEELSALDGVSYVTWDAGDSRYNSGEYTLYKITLETTSTKKTDSFMKSLVKSYKKNYTVYGYYLESEDSVVGQLVPWAILIVLVILLIMCNAFFEPVLMLASIGVAILINMGTNIIFASVASMTYSIAAVLQLILSIDYSVMLMHRYGQERRTIEGMASREKAMENTLCHSFGSISGSSLTTCVGLLALLIMSFTIGTDMGLVLAKGVIFSLICVFTTMPALILWSDKLLKITDKKYVLEKIREHREKRGRGPVTPSESGGTPSPEGDLPEKEVVK